VFARRLAKVIDIPSEDRADSYSFRSSLIHAHGLPDGVFNIERGAVTEQSG
jgi:hypothetical protein